MNNIPQFYQQRRIPSSAARWWKNFTDNKLATSALLLLSLIILIAIFSPFIAPYDPTLQSADYLLPPSWYEDGTSAHIFGTDALGRDLFSRLAHGAGLSLKLATFVVAIAASVGIFLGSLTALSNQFVDQITIRIMDLVLALPSLLLAVVIVAIIGPGLPNAIYAVAIVLIPHFVLVTRSAIKNEVNKEYVTAMILDGSGKIRLFCKSIFPNILPPLIVQLTLAFSTAILEIAALGFLGLGAQAPHPEWGTILSESHNNIVNAPWTVTLPGLAIFFTLLSINLVGDGLRDAMDLGN
ncbi:ABC transporter permease subunit [Aliikangiella coralliicola]|uniref:ABC transporter permease subunit n=1 Tax=Aliikangiella coralliicola TaxID=2592383 RepID=A0A545UAW7_9GAMM|nr:ABC transporter permease subunit [Aliikangiella coralliicola]TQV86614.1 ABC transporter permease subunit [Aliikangiella coralliicola]